MPKAIRMSESNLHLLVDETYDSLLTHQSNMECYTEDFGSAPICLIAGSKEVGNLVVTWWCQEDFDRNWKTDEPLSETDFVNCYSALV